MTLKFLVHVPVYGTSEHAAKALAEAQRLLAFGFPHVTVTLASDDRDDD